MSSSSEHILSTFKSISVTENIIRFTFIRFASEDSIQREKQNFSINNPNKKISQHLIIFHDLKAKQLKKFLILNATLAVFSSDTTNNIEF